MHFKGSLTVEGSLVMGICMLVMGMCIMLSFSIYHESISYMNSINIEEMNVVERFRMIKFGSDLIEDIKGD